MAHLATVPALSLELSVRSSPFSFCFATFPFEVLPAERHDLFIGGLLAFCPSTWLAFFLRIRRPHPVSIRAMRLPRATSERLLFQYPGSASSIVLKLMLELHEVALVFLRDEPRQAKVLQNGS